MQRRYIYHPITNKYLTFNGDNNPVTLERFNLEEPTRQQWDIGDGPAQVRHQVRSVANPEQCLDTRVEYILPQKSLLYTRPCVPSDNSDAIYQQWVFINPNQVTNSSKGNIETYFQIMNPNFNQSYLDATSNTNIEYNRYIAYFNQQGYPIPKLNVDNPDEEYNNYVSYFVQRGYPTPQLDTRINTEVEYNRYVLYFRQLGLGLPIPRSNIDVYFNRSNVFDQYQRFTFPPI